MWLQLCLFSRLVVLCGSLEEDIFRVSEEENPREKELSLEIDSWKEKAAAGERLPWHGLRVVAALTTTPRRISQIEPALDSLLAQTWPLDLVYLFVPQVFKRENTTYMMPSWLLSKLADPRLRLIRCEDWGPATHMMEVLQAERDPETAILQVDDDQSYGPHLLETLLHVSGPAPGRAVGAATQHAHLHLSGVVLEGVHGVLFRRKFFDESVFDYTGFSKHCQLHDDLWLSAHLARKAHVREALSSRFGTKPLPFGFGKDALYRGGAGSDNTKNFFLCSASLLQAFPDLWDQKYRVVVAAPLGRGTSESALRRLVGAGAQALYLLGEVAPEHTVTSQRAFRVSGGVHRQLGTFASSFEVTMKSCHASCDLAEALSAALQFEEDPTTLVILSPAAVAGPLDFRSMVQWHVSCTRKAKPSRELCRREDGSISFRRLAAYPADRIQGAIFMPKFSQHFYVHRHAGALRDMDGPWRESPTLRAKLDLIHGQGLEDPVVKAFLAEGERLPRRVVVVLAAPAAALRLAARAGRMPGAQRIVVALRARAGARRCGVGSWAAQPRLRIACMDRKRLFHPLLAVLDLEKLPETQIFLRGFRRKVPPLSDFLQASDLWAGVVIASHASLYGEHGGPIPVTSLGALYRRGFFDERIIEDLHGPCAQEPDLVVASHIALNGVPTEVLGASSSRPPLPTSRSTECWSELIERHPWLWTSLRPRRVILHVALMDDTDDFLLGLTLRYAVSQTRRPDEVVLLTVGQSNFEDSGEVDTDTQVRHGASIRIEGSRCVVVSRRGRRLPIRLPHFLATIGSGKVGAVLRTSDGRGPTVSILRCSGDSCRPKPHLAAAFYRELEPSTAMIFCSAERLINERLVEENVACLDSCAPHCSPQNWCGQASTREDGALYDLSITRAAGYVDHVARCVLCCIADQLKLSAFWRSLCSMKPSADDEVVCGIVVAVVLRALPKRLVPARSFMSASFHIAQSLIDAWLAAHAATLSATTSADALKSRLQSLVGATCTNAWWDDASERLEGGSPTLPLQRKLAEVLTRGRQGLRSVSPVPPAQGATGGEAWPERGAAWVLAALEDVVGSVASHSARKAATVKDAARPSTAGSRPGTAQRPATGTQGRHQFQPPVRLQEGTAPSKQTERLRLLGIKHFVAAAKADDDLQNCQLVATCLADVAMGLAPHLESDDLMACADHMLFLATCTVDVGGKKAPAPRYARKHLDRAAYKLSRALRSSCQIAWRMRRHRGVPSWKRAQAEGDVRVRDAGFRWQPKAVAEAEETVAEATAALRFARQPPPGRSELRRTIALERLAFENMKISWWDGTAPLKEGRISDAMDSRTEDSNWDSPSSDRVRDQTEVPAVEAKEEPIGSEGYVLNRAEHLLKCLMDGEAGSRQGETELRDEDQSFRTLSRHVQDNRQLAQQATSLPGVCEGLQFDSGLVPPKRIIHRAQPEYRERLVAWAAQECQGPKDPSAIQQAILQAMKVTPAATSSRGQISTKVPSATAKPSQPAGPVRGSWLPKVFVREFNAEGDEVEPDSGDDVFTGGAAIA
ncbi:unnamed protein product [Symbiodinium microadriaticum]|nr:unnamed protein product [Symbiodinium microadriaticum]